MLQMFKKILVAFEKHEPLIVAIINLVTALILLFKAAQ